MNKLGRWVTTRLRAAAIATGVFVGVLLDAVFKEIDHRNEMKAFHLHPKNMDTFMDKYPDHRSGQTWGAVVIARSEREAREVAAQAGGDAWLDASETECEDLNPSEYTVPALVVDEPHYTCEDS